MLNLVQRFTGVNPLASSMPAWSPYNYVLGNPVRLVDPDGRMPLGTEDPPKKVVSMASEEFTSTVIPNNGVRLTYESSLKTTTTFHGSSKTEIKTVITQTTVDLNVNGEITLATQDVNEVVEVRDGTVKISESCVSTCGAENVDIGSKLSQVVGAARSFANSQQSDNPGEPLRNFNHALSGNADRAETGKSLTYSGAVIASLGLKVKHPVLSGVGTAVTILGGALQLGDKSEATVSSSSIRSGVDYFYPNGDRR